MATLKSSLKKKERPSLAMDHVGGDDSSAGGEDLDNSARDDSSSASSSRSSLAAAKGCFGRFQSSLKKRLHLELFGITWFDFAAMSCARWMFLFALMGAATGLTVAVYMSLSDDEQENFENEFDDLAHQVIDLSNEAVNGTFNIISGVTIAMISSIQAASATSVYPSGFNTMLDFEHFFGTARTVSDAMVLAYTPLVESDQLDEWATYSESNQYWIAETNKISPDSPILDPILPNIWQYADSDKSHAYLKECQVGGGNVTLQTPTTGGNVNETQLNSTNNTTRRSLEHLHGDLAPKIDPRIPLRPRNGPFSPIWTYSPGPMANDTFSINHDLFSKPNFEAAVNSVRIARQPMFMDVCNLAAWFNHYNQDEEELQAVIAYPVFSSFDDDAPVVGNIIEVLPWRVFFDNILSDDTKPILVVLKSSCGQVATFEISGPNATLISQEDVHDSQYDYMAVTAPFAAFANPPDLIQKDDIQGVCNFTMVFYPTTELEDEYKSQQPIYFALVVLSVFLATSILFFLFDRIQTRQRNNIIQTAKKQNILVSSLFPKSVQAKIMEQVDAETNKLSKVGKAGLRQFIDHEETNGEQKQANRNLGIPDKSKPIADLFPETTIMFADIAGFTAWSSAREPSQVFILLETIYHEFDAIAKRRRVFKVEVVGDCYVAVCGLPDPRPDHAVVMAKFASECVHEMSLVASELESELGPDTSELALRGGLHSGPVVAGVLRGEKSRFQLFGDTMNTAARMESTGIPGRVQISQETADLLDLANKSHWYEARPDKVVAKGKGELSTFLLKIHQNGKTISSGYASESDSQSVTSSLNSSTHFHDATRVAEKRNRIADWTMEVLAGLLQEIEVRRRASQTKSEPSHKLLQLEQSSTYTNESTVIDDVKEIIELPEFDLSAAQREAKMDPESIELSDDVLWELQNFVRTIASMYHDNPFHNFAHANHVTMSVVKLLGRIKAPDVQEVKGSLHDHTYGITSDPLTRFAVVFSALIHDVDHMGVSNMQLVKEEDPVAVLYKNKSVAEQNSIDVAWDLLMEPRFDNLRRQIYTTENEFYRFRQLVINTVLATDIMDKDLKDLRNKRWADAFAEDQRDESPRQAINRKATIVIEHLIQASDVAHTMQHWHIYRKWNERLFQELYRAWEGGRLDNDPSLNWYKGEMGFFDFYIIPLAKKLKECGVFGVSSDEYLSYALQNRKEWEARGEEIVEEMVKSVKRKRVADSVYLASQANVDPQGQEIVAELSKSIRRSSQIPVQEEKPPSRVLVHKIASTAPNTIDNGSSDASDSEGSDDMEELEMNLKPM